MSPPAMGPAAVGSGPRPATRADLPAPGGHVHFVGIAGAGMRGLARLFLESGYRISGCDRGGTTDLGGLEGRAVALHAEHDPSHAEGVDLMVRSSAVPADAPEIASAMGSGVPVLRRARALGALLNDGDLIGIAGTHGKTTITAMAGYACEAAGLDPVVLVGGNVPAWGGFARPGTGPAIVEADEYDRSFLELRPRMALVSSLEPEHLDTYGSFEAVEEAYAEYAGGASGGVVYGADDAGARRIGARFEGSRGYGFSADAWCRVEWDAGAARLVWPGGHVPISLRVPGRHNLQNAAGAFAVALLAGGDPGAIARGLEAFPGVGRRLEHLVTRGGVTVIDDYAHHPTEVAASIAAVRAAHPGAAIHAVFQPHLYSRTRDFAGAFADALSAADEAGVLPIYPAREARIEGITSALIASGERPRVRGIDPAEAVALPGELARGEAAAVVLYMGAGDITAIAREAARKLADGAVGT